jgi:hypothetical protein
MFLVVCAVAIGLWRGWFSFSNPVHDATSDKVNVSISVDTKKVESDLATMKQKIAEKVAERVKIVESDGTTPAPSPR